MQLWKKIENIIFKLNSIIGGKIKVNIAPTQKPMQVGHEKSVPSHSEWLAAFFLIFENIKLPVII